MLNIIAAGRYSSLRGRALQHYIAALATLEKKKSYSTAKCRRDSTSLFTNKIKNNTPQHAQNKHIDITQTNILHRNLEAQKIQ